jgi:hypothetical protein
VTLDELIEAISVRTSKSRQSIEVYHVASGLALGDALDAIARAVARRYAAGSLGFAVADTIMNDVFAYASMKTIVPPFMFSVFRAFDAGEFYPDAIRAPSPEERFTRPLIAEILADDKTA